MRQEEICYVTTLSTENLRELKCCKLSLEDEWEESLRSDLWISSRVSISPGVFCVSLCFPIYAMLLQEKKTQERKRLRKRWSKKSTVLRTFFSLLLFSCFPLLRFFLSVFAAIYRACSPLLLSRCVWENIFTSPACSIFIPRTCIKSVYISMCRRLWVFFPIWRGGVSSVPLRSLCCRF